jgi:hypothetical protein
MARQEQATDKGGAGASAGRHTMPAGIRRALFAGVGLLLAGALYLIAVRGEVLLSGLTTLARYCF